MDGPRLYNSNFKSIFVFISYVLFRHNLAFFAKHICLAKQNVQANLSGVLNEKKIILDVSNKKAKCGRIINPIQGGKGVRTHPIPGVCVCAISHTPTNFWTTGDTELKFYVVIDIHKLFPKIEQKLGWKCLLCIYDVIVMKIVTDFRPNRTKSGVLLNR